MQHALYVFFFIILKQLNTNNDHKMIRINDDRDEKKCGDRMRLICVCMYIIYMCFLQVHDEYRLRRRKKNNKNCFDLDLEFVRELHNCKVRDTQK